MCRQALAAALTENATADKYIDAQAEKIKTLTEDYQDLAWHSQREFIMPWWGWAAVGVLTGVIIAK